MHGTVALANPRTPEQSPAGRFPFHFPVFRRHFIHRRFCSNTRFSAFPVKAWPEETTGRDISSVPAKQVPSYEKPECRATTQRRKRPCSCTDSKKISERHVLLIQLLRVKKGSAVLPLVVPPLMCPLPEKTAKYPATGTGFHFPLFQPDREHPPEKPPRDGRSASATPRNRQIVGKTVQKRHKPVPTACPDGFFSGQGIHPVKKTGQLQTTSWMDTVCTENGTEIAKNLFPLRDPSKQPVRPGFLQPSIKARYLQPPFFRDRPPASPDGRNKKRQWKIH